MLPEYKPDFYQSEKLSTIVTHPKLRMKKYGHYPDKYVRILCNRELYQADRHFLDVLMNRYGDVSFAKAIEQWRKDFKKNKGAK